MARIKSVKKAQKSTKTRRCNQCGHEVQAGESYRYIDKKTGPRTGFRLIFCKDHWPKTSDTLSGRAAELAVISEDYADTTRDCGETPGDIGTFKEALDSMASSIQELAESIKESATNMEEGFGHETAQTTAMNETADNLADWADNILSHTQDVPDDAFPEMECQNCNDWIAVRLCPTCGEKLSIEEMTCETCDEDVEPDTDGDCPQCGDKLCDGDEYTCINCDGKDVESGKEVEPDSNGDCPMCGNNLVDTEDLTEPQKEWLNEIDDLVNGEPELQLTA